MSAYDPTNPSSGAPDSGAPSSNSNGPTRTIKLTMSMPPLMGELGGKTRTGSAPSTRSTRYTGPEHGSLMPFPLTGLVMRAGSGHTVDPNAGPNIPFLTTGQDFEFGDDLGGGVISPGKRRVHIDIGLGDDGGGSADTGGLGAPALGGIPGGTSGGASGTNSGGQSHPVTPYTGAESDFEKNAKEIVKGIRKVEFFVSAAGGDNPLVKSIFETIDTLLDEVDLGHAVYDQNLLDGLSAILSILADIYSELEGTDEDDDTNPLEAYGSHFKRAIDVLIKIKKLADIFRVWGGDDLVRNIYDAFQEWFMGLMGETSKWFWALFDWGNIENWRSS